MVPLRALAPTIIDALKAVEMGCRKIQDDPCFLPDMLEWMNIVDTVCVGCLATCTFMQLTGKSGTDIVGSFPKSTYPEDKYFADRALAYGVEIQVDSDTNGDACLFEGAINSLRQNDLVPLLEFYGLDTHKYADDATEWLREFDTPTLGYGTTKEDMLLYADFLRDELIPKMETTFAG
jgi:hypothetical protein